MTAAIVVVAAVEDDGDENREWCFHDAAVAGDDGGDDDAMKNLFRRNGDCQTDGVVRCSTDALADSAAVDEAALVLAHLHPGNKERYTASQGCRFTVGPRCGYTALQRCRYTVGPRCGG